MNGVFREHPVGAALFAAFGVVVTACGPGLFTPGGAPSAPHIQFYDLEDAYHALGQPDVRNFPKVEGDIDSFSISPELPGGLLFNSKTGVISGVPSQVSPKITYLITATGPEGMDSIEINVEVADAHYVNSLGAGGDASPGDGVCATGTGECTFLAAIQESNAVPKPILIKAGTYLIGAQFGVNSSYDIRGERQDRVLLDGGSGTFLFSVSFTANKISQLTIQNFNHSGGGGAISQSANTTLTVEDVTFRNGISGGVSGGGAVFLSAGTSIFSRAKFLNNQATGGEGGAVAIVSSANVSFSDCLFQDNASAANFGGGAIFINGATLLIERSLIRGNNAPGTGSGGGVYDSGASTVTLKNTALTQNTADTGGGAVINAGGSLVNVTVAGNSIRSNTGAGAGLRVGAMTIQNTIVAANLQDSLGTPNLNNCGGPGTFTSLGNNITDEGGTPCDIGNGTADQVSTNPMLGSLSNEGGFTLSLPLLNGSPAIDSGDNAACPVDDQRGVPRSDGNCDIGAYEF